MKTNKQIKITLTIAEAEAVQADFEKSMTYNYWDNKTTKFLAEYFKRELREEPTA